MPDSPSRTTEGGTVLMTTHLVVIKADDETQAAWLLEALTNDGYRAEREVRELVSDDNGDCSLRTKAHV